MRRWIVAAIAIVGFIVACVIVGTIYIYSGSYNVAATEAMTGLERYVFGTITEQSVLARAEAVAHPAVGDSALVRRGYQNYRDMCVMCHGAPGVEAGWVGQGLRPEPPELDHAAEEMSTGELFWIAKHGIKHTGMPAMAPTHDEEEIHAVVAFVEELPEMTEEEYAAFEREAGSDTTAVAAGGDGHEGHEH